MGAIWEEEQVGGSGKVTGDGGGIKPILFFSGISLRLRPAIGKFSVSFDLCLVI